MHFKILCFLINMILHRSELCINGAYISLSEVLDKEDELSRAAPLRSKQLLYSS